MKTYLLAVVIGIGAFASSWAGWHLYQDHQHIDQVWQLVNQPRPQASAPTRAPSPEAR
jgi:hypothetical protein